MPKDKKTPKFIDPTLQDQCNLLINKEDKRRVANETGLSISMISSVISGDRYNSNIITSLETIVKEKVDTLNKQIA